MKAERIVAELKIHAAIRDTTIEQRVSAASHVEQATDVEPTCLDDPRALPHPPACG
jgi:hypothetical protein